MCLMEHTVAFMSKVIPFVVRETINILPFSLP